VELTQSLLAEITPGTQNNIIFTAAIMETTNRTSRNKAHPALRINYAIFKKTSK
jgi:hypothetical protein